MAFQSQFSSQGLFYWSFLGGDASAWSNACRCDQCNCIKGKFITKHFTGMDK